MARQRPIVRSRVRLALAIGLGLVGMIAAYRASQDQPPREPTGSPSSRFVRPGGAGAKDGSSWANAFDGLPPKLERGTVYWVGAGAYGPYVLDDALRDSREIVLRKATAEAHGSDIGWVPQLGEGQAVFGPLRFETGHYTLDGGEPNGFHVVGRMGTEATVLIEGSHVMLRHVEVDGGFREAGGKQVAGGCNGSNVHGDHTTFDRCEIHSIADDGIGIYATHVRVLHSTIHNLHGCGTDGDCGPCYNGHSDGIEMSGASDIELVGNLVYDVLANAALYMDDWSGSAVRGLLVYNNVFYTPDTGFAVYLQKVKGAKVHNNVIWGKTQGSKYGGLSIGPGIEDLEAHNNIILNINFSHMGAKQDPAVHRLDYNWFGMVNSDEYSAASHDLIGDPRFAAIPMSGDPDDHRSDRIMLGDFEPHAAGLVDSATTPSGVPAVDIVGRERPQGSTWDRGPFEALPR